MAKTQDVPLVADGGKEEGEGDFAQMLLKRSETLVAMSAQRGNESESALSWPSYGAKFDVRLGDGGEPLHLAALGGRHKSLLLLLKGRAKVDAAYSSESDAQPIHLAARNGHASALSVLLRHRAPLTARCGRFGTEPIHVAAFHGHVKAVRTLLRYGASVSDADTDHGSVTHCAAAGGHCELLAFLLRRRARADERSLNGTQPLHCAAAHGHSAVIELLLSSRACVEAATNWSGTQPIHAAAAGGSVDAVAFLVLKRAAVDAQRHDGAQPVHSATLSGADTVLLKLLALRAQVDAERKDAFRPIHDAASWGHVSTVALLLDRAASANARVGHGEQPIHMASFFGFHGVVEVLMERRAEVDATLFGAGEMHFAALVGNVPMLGELLEKQARVDLQDEAGARPIHWASASGHVAALSLLLDRRAHVDVSTHPDGQEPIHAVADRGHSNAASLLLLHRARVDAVMSGGVQPVHLAAKKGHTELVILLHRAGASLEAHALDCGRPIHCAAGANRSDVLRWLLAHRCDSEAEWSDRQRKRRQPIHVAVMQGHVEIVSFLLKHGASFDMSFDWEQPGSHHSLEPMHVAALMGHEGLLWQLLKHGANPTAEDRAGVQPIHWAAFGGSTSTLHRLLSWRVAVDVHAHDGRQPLHWAVDGGQPHLVELLVAQRANVNAPLGNGLRPLDLAARQGGEETLRFLLDHGGTHICSDGDPLFGANCKLVLQQHRHWKRHCDKLWHGLGNSDEVVASVLESAAAAFRDLGLPQSAAAAAAKASECEFRLRRFEQCIKNCDDVLAVAPPLPGTAGVLERRRSALDALVDEVESGTVQVGAEGKSGLAAKLMRLKRAIDEEERRESEKHPAASSLPAISVAEDQAVDFEIVPMGQFAFTAFFLRHVGWCRHAYPLDWSTATFPLWRHMILDNYEALRQQRVPGSKHKYNVWFWPDAAVFTRRGDWANDKVSHQVRRLRAILGRCRAVGFAVYFEGQQHCSQSLDEILEDASVLASIEPGFHCIVVVWLQYTLQGAVAAPAWSKYDERVVLLKYTVRRPIEPIDKPADFPEDMERLARTLKVGLPQYFARTPHDTGSDSESSAHEVDETFWQVAVSSGVVVREGASFGSKAFTARLEVGARVAELELVGRRLHYKKVSGDGPEFGWVSVCLGANSANELLVREGDEGQTPNEVDTPPLQPKLEEAGVANEEPRAPVAKLPRPAREDTSQDSAVPLQEPSEEGQAQALGAEAKAQAPGAEEDEPPKVQPEEAEAASEHVLEEQPRERGLEEDTSWEPEAEEEGEGSSPPQPPESRPRLIQRLAQTMTGHTSVRHDWVQWILEAGHTQPMQAWRGRPLYVVVHARDKEGLVVRAGKELASLELTAKLAEASVVETLRVAGNRLHYRRIYGTGPDSGWVNLRTPDRWAICNLERLTTGEWRLIVAAEAVRARQRGLELPCVESAYEVGPNSAG